MMEDVLQDQARTTDVTLYDDTGRILSVVAASPSTLQGYLDAGVHLLFGLGDWRTQMVVDHELAPRPANPTRLDGLTLTDLPAPATIAINGAQYACPDTTATLSFKYPGLYKIRVQAWPYLDADFTVTHDH